MTDEGRRLSSVERLTIQWVNTTFRRQPSRQRFDEPSMIKVKTFAARVKAASVTFMLAFVFFSLHISGVINTCCKILGITSSINGEIANSISFLTPTVQCVVYGLKFRGFWVFYYTLLLRFVLRVKDVLGHNTAIERNVSEELLNEARTNLTRFSPELEDRDPSHAV